MRIMPGSIDTAIVDWDGTKAPGWLGAVGGADAMADRVNYNDEAFRAAARSTGGVRDRVNGVLNDLERNINGRGEPWGGDSLGQSFYNGQNNDGYGSGKTNLITSGRNVAGTMGAFHDGQVETADYLRDMEDGNADGLQS